MKVTFNNEGGRTYADLCREYEVLDIYQYIIDSYINGNFDQVKELFSEMNRNAQGNFLLWCLAPENHNASENGCGMYILRSFALQ